LTVVKTHIFSLSFYKSELKSFQCLIVQQQTDFSHNQSFVIQTAHVGSIFECKKTKR